MIFKKWIAMKYRDEFAARLDICRTCEHCRNGICGICGCFVIAKTKVPELSCQKGKWKALR